MKVVGEYSRVLYICFAVVLIIKDHVVLNGPRVARVNSSRVLRI